MLARSWALYFVLCSSCLVLCINPARRLDEQSSKHKEQSNQMMSNFLNWREFEGSNAEKFYKTTLWQGEHVMVGLNCLEPGQVQPVHAHAGADKFYLVLAGRGSFTVGQEQQTAETGTVVVAPAGVSHGVTNDGRERLSLLVAIAPSIK